MRNTIVFNLNNFDCDCLAAVDDGTNTIAIEARKSGFSSPYIAFTLADGTTATENLQLNGGIIGYEIPKSYYELKGAITFKIKDGEYSSPAVTIIGAENTSGNDLTLRMESNTRFSCKVATVTPEGGEFGDEWKTIINANTAARHSHNNKGALDVIEAALTNTEIEALLND